MTPPEPLFSIVTTVYAPPVDDLRAMIDSVLAQTHRDWELILVDDASPDPLVLETLRRAASEDARIRVIERETEGHIVAASNVGIAAARGSFIVLVDHDDLLAAQALEKMKNAVEDNADVDYLYSDEDKVHETGRFYDVFRKPPWSPERFRGQMYTGHVSVLRTSLVREVGGFHEGFDGAQDYDLVLRVTERARTVVHVPNVLYHSRAVAGSSPAEPDAGPDAGPDADADAWLAGQKAVQAHLDRTDVTARVNLGPRPGTYQLERSLDPQVRVSVVIPTRGGEGVVWGERRCFVVEAVRSLLQRGGHDNVEVVVVYDTETPSEVLEQLGEAAGASLVLVPYDKPFNFSEKCNLGVLASQGEVVMLLNDDVEIASKGFVAQMVAPLFEDAVGLTGARLLYPDGTLQHAGLAFYRTHLLHMFYHWLDDAPGPFNGLVVNRECSGLTGACVAVKRSTYDEVGGLTESLPINYNDVDFSFKIGRAGYSRVWIANAKAYHFESQTRVAVVHDWESKIIRRRWATPEFDLYMPMFGRTLGEVRKPSKSARRRRRRSDTPRSAGKTP